MRPQTNVDEAGRGGYRVHRWNSTSTGRTSDVGGKQSTCSNGGRGTPSHSYSCLWKLVHLPRSLLETIWHKARNIQPPWFYHGCRDSRTSVTSRLGEGKKLTKVEWCLAGSVHLLAHPWGIISFLFLLGEYLVRAWLDFRVDHSFSASFIRCCCLSAWLEDGCRWFEG